MARLTTTAGLRYPSMKKEQLQAPVHFVIDMVNGFVRRGALHDEAIASIIALIEDMIERLAWFVGGNAARTRRIEFRRAAAGGRSLRKKD